MEIKTVNFEDFYIAYFNLKYSDIELYSVTMVDAYRNPWARIMTKKELVNLLEDYGRNT